MNHLGAIDLFNRVVETGSFSETGRQANLSTSSVSRHIAELEEWVGAALFHRTTRSVNLTEAGRRFHQHTQNMLLDLDEARLIASQKEGDPSGLLRVSIPASLEQHIVVAASVFQAQWPEVSFSLISTDRNIDLITEGFDLVIRAGEMKDSTLKARRIATVQRRLCASPQYLATAPELIQPSDIENHDCLIFNRTQRRKIWRFKGNRDVIEVEASGKFIANSGNMLVTAARHGRGLFLSPDWIVGPYIASGDLIELLSSFSPYPANSTLYAVHPYQRFIPPKVKGFIDFLIEHFSDSYDWSASPTNL